jgi:hypothetical protein
MQYSKGKLKDNICCSLTNQINITMDSKQNVGSPDRDRINIHEDYEVEYWTRQLGVSKEELSAAVEAVGTSADAVREHLKK